MPLYGPPSRNPVPDVRQPYYGGNDYFQQAENNRQRASAYGDMMNQEMQDFGNEEDWWRQYYRGEGNSAYGEIAAGRGGYNEAERNNIMGADRLNGMQMTPEQRQALYLSDAEQEAMYGDPNKGLQWFDPETLDAINTEGNQRIRENVAESGRNLNNTYNEDALSLSRGYRDELGNIINTGANNVRGTLNAGAGNVRGAIDRAKMTLDPNFLKDYRMSDRDVDDMTQSAALTQGNVSRGRADAVRRAAAGSGMSPMALANGLSELTTRGDQQANRAMLDARIGANGMQADRLKTAEAMRLGAEDNYAGLASNAEIGLGARALSAEQGIADRAYGAATDYEKQRLGSEQDKQSRQYQIQANIADRGYDSTNRQNANNMNTAQYRGETGAALYNAADNAAVTRSGNIAGNRQSATRYGQESDLDRQKYADTATSQRATGVANSRLDAEAEYRKWLAAQQGQSNENVNQSYQNRIRNYGQAGQMAQQATQSGMGYQMGKDSNSFGANFKRGLGSALGSFIGNPARAVSDSRKAYGGN